jgi:GAF domain-containing protein
MADLDDPMRLAAFSPAILDAGEDVILRDCVERASIQAQAPMAMVSFVMKRVQLFRAAVGLPPELAATRAVSRNRSFCQFVVKAEAPVIVTDANSDARLPRILTDVYGIRAYAGVPIRVGGEVLGALCVADDVPRRWSSELIYGLRGLGERVSERLETLKALAATEDDTTMVPPSNLAARASALAQIVHRSLVEVGPMVRLAKALMEGISPEGLSRASRVLTEASDVYDDAMNAAVDLYVATRRVEQSGSKTAAKV